MIKNIIYLDEAKMYSLSSQIFEGITEYLLKETNSMSENVEEQKGPMASGKLLADAMRYGERSIEKRFLHDYAFSIFENKLNESSLVLDVNAGIKSDISQLLGQKAFVRVSSQATFIDAAKITSLMSSFNKLGEALTHITRFSELNAAREALQKMKETVTNKTKLAEIHRQEKSLLNISELAKASGLYQDPKFLEHLAMVTEFGFSDQLEVQQRVADYLYSSCLKRQCLRESDDLTIRKYSRKTEKNLVVLGIATQTPTKSVPDISTAELEFENVNMKTAMTNLIEHIASLEGTMTGKADDEVIIDPIAVYVTL